MLLKFKVFSVRDNFSLVKIGEAFFLFQCSLAGVSGKIRKAPTIETKKEIVEVHSKGVRVVDLKFKVNKSPIETFLKKEEVARVKVAKEVAHCLDQ